MAAPGFATAPLPLSLLQAASGTDSNTSMQRWGGQRPRLRSRSQSTSGTRLPLASVSAPAGGPPALLRGSAPDTFRKGDALAGGRFVLQEKLYDGRFATVWACSDRQAGGGSSGGGSSGGGSGGSSGNGSVVLKLMEPGDTASLSAGQREAAAHAAAGRHPNIAALLGSFEHRSKAGRHACMVFEPLGPSLSRVAAEAGGGLRIGLPLDVVRSVARQSLSALDHLHRERKLVHMAVIPDNLLLDKPFASLLRPPPSNPLQALARGAGDAWRTLTGGGGAAPAAAASGGEQPAAMAAGSSGAEAAGGSAPDPTKAAESYSEANLASAVVKLTDFGRALPLDALDSPQGREPLVIYAAPGYRPPEEILALEYRAPAYDMWGLGCTLFSLATGSDLFSPSSDAGQWQAAGASTTKAAAGGGGGDFDANDSHLTQMLAVLGRLPREMVAASPLQRLYFLPSGRLRVEARFAVPPASLQQLLVQAHGFEEEEADAFVGFLGPLLEPTPQRRASAAKMLKHPWLAEAPGGDKGGSGAKVEGGGKAKR